MPLFHFISSFYLFTGHIRSHCNTESFIALCGLQNAYGLSSCSVRGSLVMACGVLAPRAGLEPEFPASEGGFLTTGPPGKSPISYFIWRFGYYIREAMRQLWYTLALVKYLSVSLGRMVHIK